MQRQLSNGRWVDASDKFIVKAAAYNNTSESEITDRLMDGEEVRYDDDWYAYIRNQPRPRAARPAQATEMCSCGHSVPQGHAMMTAQGTSCPSCYDKMSD